MVRQQKSYKDLISEEELGEGEKKEHLPSSLRHSSSAAHSTDFVQVEQFHPGLQLLAFTVMLYKPHFSSGQTTDCACLLKFLFFRDKP